jgi:hypothetical protein
VIWTAHPVVHWWPFAITKTPPVILSRPQLLVAPIIVIAEVKAGQNDRPDGEVKVVAVQRPAGDPNHLMERTLIVTDLHRVNADHGWHGPGEYILPLSPHNSDFRVTPLPSSPGFDAKGRDYPLQIYPANAQTQRQLEEIRWE